MTRTRAVASRLVFAAYLVFGPARVPGWRRDHRQRVVAVLAVGDPVVALHPGALCGSGS